MKNNEIILVTGSAGFIGFSVTRKLLQMGYTVIGLDSLNEYYDINLKLSRNEILKQNPAYSFHHINLCNLDDMKKLFAENNISRVCHLAAQAGVRYSLTHPFEYQKSNLEGFTNIIEMAKNAKVKNFVYASSSSVYGKNDKYPFSEKDPVNTPISLYASTKRSNELTAHTYSHLFGLPTSGLRFFTVYGPWGRPDMALFLFTRAILSDEPIDVYNKGDMQRSFTYIDDIVEGVIAALKTESDYEIFNLGNNTSVLLKQFIEILEDKIGKKAVKNYMPIQPGDVKSTVADIDHAAEILNFSPKTDVCEGISNFVDWYRNYYQV